MKSHRLHPEAALLRRLRDRRAFRLGDLPVMLSGKRGEQELHDFKHPYLKSIRPRWKAYSSGGMVIDAWFIVPNVPISPLEKDFDESKLPELGDAAIRHAKSHKLACDIYVVEI